jgi:hypothetical protein
LLHLVLFFFAKCNGNIALISRCPGLCLLVVYNMALEVCNSFAKSPGHVICVSGCHEQIIYLEFISLWPFPSICEQGCFSFQFVPTVSMETVCSHKNPINCCKVGETLWITASPIFTQMQCTSLGTQVDRRLIGTEVVTQHLKVSEMKDKWLTDSAGLDSFSVEPLDLERTRSSEMVTQQGELPDWPFQHLPTKHIRHWGTHKHLCNLWQCKWRLPSALSAAAAKGHFV